MRKILHYFIYIAILLSIYTCQSELVEPIDIFETENLDDAYEIDLGSTAGLDTLYVNADRIEETKNGYHIKGTLFSKTLLGTIPITNGDFNIITNQSATNLKSGFKADFSSFSFHGYGTANFPKVGILESTEISDIPGSDVYYNTGEVFKLESKITLLPLKNERYYFRYKIDNPKKGKEYKIKNSSFKLREFYLDAYDPATLFIGDLYSKNKKGVKTLIAEQVGVGLSANELWEFEPYEYSERLNEAVGGTGFEKMNGGIYISGIVPLKKYPVKVLGEAIINTSFSSLGTMDFFERGFDEASFRMGANGTLFFNNKLLTFLSSVDTIELGKATMQVEFDDNSSAVRMAGEYTQDYLKTIVGEQRMKNISFNEKQGMMYLRCTDNLDDFIIYLEEDVQFNVPGLGSKELAKTVFSVTKDQVEVSGVMNLPYGIGDVEVLGQINTDGSFLLKGNAESAIDIGNGMSYAANLEIEISNNGVSMTGSIEMPYDIGNVAVEGKINLDGTILLKGSFSSSINFGNGLAYEAALDLELSNLGISLYGKINLPFNIGDVEVVGGISADEIFLSGTANASIGIPTDVYVKSSLRIQISSNTGVLIEGNVDLPVGIGSVNIIGEISSSGLLLTGEIGSGINIKVGNIDIQTSTSMSLTISSNSGVIFTGDVMLPMNLGYANVSASIIPGDAISFTGKLGSHINIAGYPAFGADMNVAASTARGIRLYGNMKFPGGLGNIYVSGNVTNSSYRFTGGLSGAEIDFKVITLSVDFDVEVSNTKGVKVTANGEGSVGIDPFKITFDGGVDVNINYNTGSVKLCIDCDPLDDPCIGF